jgi:flagellar P-ring protein precursor FlgI
VLGGADDIRLFMRKADFTTTAAVAKKINESLHNESLHSDYASPIDPSSIRLRVPVEYRSRMVEFITFVEGIDVPVDLPAKVVINERTGTVVIGEKVRIAPVAIAHGSLTIEIKTEFKVSQPAPFGPESSKTVVVPQKDVNVKEEKAALVPVSGATLGEIVRALNALGVTPRDLISILQALKASGALRAELEII